MSFKKDTNRKQKDVNVEMNPDIKWRRNVTTEISQLLRTTYIQAGADRSKQYCVNILFYTGMDNECVFVWLWWRKMKWK